MPDLTSADHSEAFRRANARVRARLGFALHAGLFGVIGLLLLVVNLVVTPGALWFYWPLVFWLLGLAVHAALVFGPGMALVERWRDRELARELERIRSERAAAKDRKGSS